MFQNLSDRIDGALHKLKGKGRINEINIAESMKEIRRALLDADVNFKIAKSFTQNVRDKAIGQEVLQSLQPGQLMVKLVRDELAELMGSEAADINLSGSPTVILMSGLQGSGKTTFSGKLANYLKTKKSKHPLLVACDVYRPAAIDQLHVVGEQIGVPVYSDKDQKDPVAIALAGIAEAKSQGKNVVIIDTAGRLAVDEEMMKEIAAIHSAIKPSETLFVVDSMTGQDAVNTAKAFNYQLNFDGVKNPWISFQPFPELLRPCPTILPAKAHPSGTIPMLHLHSIVLELQQRPRSESLTSTRDRETQSAGTE